MKKTFLLILYLFSMLALFASTEIETLKKKYSGLTADKIEWEYNSASKTVIISGEGPMIDYTEYAPEWDKYSLEALHVVIGDKVTSIGAGAFMWFSELTDVKLGKSIEFIGDAAFTNCMSLRTVNFPENLKYIGSFAFNNTVLHSKDGFVLPEELIFIGDYAFHSAFKESFILIPASLTIIGKNALTNCFVERFTVDSENPAYTSNNDCLYDKNMTTLIAYPADKRDKIFIIPEGVTTILEEAIQVTNTLERIVIPKSVSIIEEGSIFNNYALSYIEVDMNNKNYKSDNGVLYTSDNKILVSYPGAIGNKKYTVLDKCEKLGRYSMSQAEKLQELHTPESLKEIGDFALFFCSSLKQIDLHLNLETIGTYGFTSCFSLNRINYTGKTEDWNRIKIGKMNELLSDGSVKIYYMPK